MSKQLLQEGVWVLAGQIMSAVGLLLGTRILTETISPEVFGEVTLTLGVIALATGTACAPLLQALLRYYPDALRDGSLPALTQVVTRSLRGVASVLVIAATIFGTAYSIWGSKSAFLGIILGALIALEIARVYAMTFLSAERQQIKHSLWLAVEAWSRPLAAVSAALILGASTEAVLLGYLSASMLLLACLRLGTVLFRNSDCPVVALDRDRSVFSKILRYSLPLAPLALVGWVSGMSDRYILGVTVGLREAGTYAATYGLVSRPFLMISTTIELTLRQMYYGAVSTKDQPWAKSVLRLWVVLTVAISLTVFAIIVAFSDVLAFLLLGPEFRDGAKLMPWIALGYVFVATSQAFERASYAHGRTDLVFVVQLIGALVSLAVTIPAIFYFGIEGAAWAVPVYFGLQLICSVAAARWSTGHKKESSKVLGDLQS